MANILNMSSATASVKESNYSRINFEKKDKSKIKVHRGVNIPNCAIQIPFAVSVAIIHPLTVRPIAIPA